ncbi:MAG: TonB-dependent receptor [Bacteroidota bacterium]
MLPRRFFVLLFLGLCTSLLAQEEPSISYRCENRPLTEVLQEWEQQYQLAFAYESRLLADKMVSLSIETQPLAAALKTLFVDSGISYELVGDRYVVLQAATTSSQTYCGRLLDAETDEPLAGATVLLAGIFQGTQTDAAGRFVLEGSWGDEQEVVFSYLGYQDLRKSLTSLQAPTCPELRLRIQSISMPTAIIREFTLDMLESDLTENRFRFNPERIPTLPGWGEPDVLRSLQLLPGVHAADGSATNLNIRGSTSDQNLLLWDGIPIYHSGHFFGQYSAINPYLVKSVDVYRGGYQAEFGGRVAGVIDIEGRPKELETAQYGVGLNLINAHAFAEIPIPSLKSSLLLGGRRSYTDLIRSPTYQNLFDLVFQRGRLSDNRDASEEFSAVSVDPELFYQDFNLKWSTQLSPRDRISYSWYAGKDQFDYRFEAGDLASNDAQSISNRGYSLRYQHEWRDQSSLQFSLTRSYLLGDYFFTYTYDRVNIPSVAEIDFRNQLRETNLGIQQQWSIGSAHQLKVGAQWQRQRIDLRYREGTFSVEQGLELNGYRARKLSAFFDYSWQPDSSWHFNFGLRREGFLNRNIEEERVFEQQNWQPRLNLNWRPFLGLPLVLRGSTGSYRQFHYQVPISLVNLGSNDQIWVVADDYFPALRSHDWSVGLQYKPTNWLFEIDWYRRKTYNLSARDLELVLNPDDPFQFRGTGLAQGVDVLLRYRQRRFSSWLAYSLAKVDYLYEDDDGEVLAFSPDHDQRHQLNLTQMMSWPRWEISLSWHWATGRPYSEPTGYRTNTNNEGTTIYQLDYGGLNNERLGSVHRLDLTANYKWTTASWRGKLGLSFYNLYDRRNLFDLDFFILPPDLAENRPGPELVDLQRQMLPFTANLFLQLEW